MCVCVSQWNCTKWSRQRRRSTWWWNTPAAVSRHRHSLASATACSLSAHCALCLDCRRLWTLSILTLNGEPRHLQSKLITSPPGNSRCSDLRRFSQQWAKAYRRFRSQVLRVTVHVVLRFSPSPFRHKVQLCSRSYGDCRTALTPVGDGMGRVLHREPNGSEPLVLTVSRQPT